MSQAKAALFSAPVVYFNTGFCPVHGVDIYASQEYCECSRAAERLCWARDVREVESLPGMDQAIRESGQIAITSGRSPSGVRLVGTDDDYVVEEFRAWAAAQGLTA